MYFDGMCPIRLPSRFPDELLPVVLVWRGFALHQRDLTTPRRLRNRLVIRHTSLSEVPRSH